MRAAARARHAAHRVVEEDQDLPEGHEVEARRRLGLVARGLPAAPAAQQPVVSVDTKKKELVGPFKNAVRHPPRNPAFGRQFLEVADEQHPKIPPRPQTRAAHPRRVEHRAQLLDEGVEPGLFQHPVQTLEEWMPRVRRKIRCAHPHRRRLPRRRLLPIAMPFSVRNSTAPRPDWIRDVQRQLLWPLVLPHFENASRLPQKDRTRVLSGRHRRSGTTRSRLGVVLRGSPGALSRAGRDRRRREDRREEVHRRLGRARWRRKRSGSSRRP